MFYFPVTRSWFIRKTKVIKNVLKISRENFGFYISNTIALSVQSVHLHCGKVKGHASRNRCKKKVYVLQKAFLYFHVRPWITNRLDLFLLLKERSIAPKVAFPLAFIRQQDPLLKIHFETFVFKGIAFLNVRSCSVRVSGISIPYFGLHSLFLYVSPVVFISHVKHCFKLLTAKCWKHEVRRTRLQKH